MNRIRKSTENYSDYKQNLIQEQGELDQKLKGKMLWLSSGIMADGLGFKKVKVQGTYNRERDGKLGGE